MRTKVKISGNVSLTTSIILMVIGSYLIKYRNIVIASLVFLLAVSIASLGLAIIVRKFRYKKESSELYVGLAMLIGGLLAAIFTTEIAQYGLVAIGALFVVFGVILIVNHAGKKAWFYMSLGIVRLVIGAALIILAFTNAGAVQSTLALLTGIVAVTMGFLFLLLEK